MHTTNHTFVSIAKQIFLMFLMGVSLGLCAGLPQSMLPFVPGDIPDLTEEERAAFELIGSLDEQELGQLMQEIEREFEKLSDEEKQQMLGEIDKEAQRLQGKINTYYSDQGLPPIAGPELVKPEPTKPKPQQKTTVQPEITKDKKELLSKRIKLAEALIARVLQVIEKYIVTGQTIPDFDDQVEQWGKEDKVKNWKRGLNWILFKDDIDRFVRKLHKIKDRDPNTKQYKYLEDVVSDESLYNNLGHLDRELQKHGSSLQGVSLDTGLLPVQAEAALQEVTGLLAEALYQLNIPAGLDKAIEPYQKVAADIKIRQEEYEKQALAEAKQSNPPRRVQPVGEEPAEYGGVSIPAMPAVKRPAYRPPSARKQPKAAPKKTEKKPELLSGKVGQGAKKAKAAGQKKTDDKKKKTDDKKKEKVKEDKRSEGFVEDLGNGLAQAMNTLDREFNRIKKDVTSKSSVNESLVKSVGSITKQVEKAAESAEKLNSRLKGLSLSREQKEVYSKQLKDEIKEHSKSLLKVSREIKQLRKNVGTDLISKEKAYSYFGGEQADKLTKEQRNSLPQTNLGSLEGALDRVLSVLKKK